MRNIQNLPFVARSDLSRTHSAPFSCRGDRRRADGLRVAGRQRSTSAATRSSTRSSSSRSCERRTSTSTTTPAEKPAAEDAARMLERWNTRLSALFNHPLSARKPIVLYADQPDFQQTNVICRSARRGHGRRDRVDARPHGDAADGLVRRERPRARPRDGARVPVRHRRVEVERRARRSSGCRCGSWKGWRSTCR